MENDWLDPDYDAIAVMYAAEFGMADADDPDVSLLRDFAERTHGGPVLDLGCGAGRFVVPLAEAGYDVTGVDTSAGMLAAARAAADDAGVGDAVTLVQDDFRTLANLGAARFRFAFCAQNTFLHMPDSAAQRRALRAIAQRLETGGVLLLDLIHPQPDLLARYYGTLTYEATFVDDAGQRVDRFVSALYHAATQTVEATWFYDTTGEDGALRRTVVPFTMRLIGRYELELLLNEAGFVLEAVYGDADLSPLRDTDDRMIAIAVKG